MLEQLATALGVKKAGLIAGFVGALISLRFVQEANTWPARVFMALAGTMAAAFLTPSVAEYLGASERVESSIAFVFGLFGMTIASALMTALRETKLGEAMLSWLKRPGA